MRANTKQGYNRSIVPLYGCGQMTFANSCLLDFEQLSGAKCCFTYDNFRLP